MTEWINLKKKQPEIGEWVIGLEFTEDGTNIQACFLDMKWDPDTGKWKSAWASRQSPINPSYWMPISKMPRRPK